MRSATGWFLGPSRYWYVRADATTEAGSKIGNCRVDGSAYLSGYSPAHFSAPSSKVSGAPAASAAAFTNGNPPLAAGPGCTGVEKAEDIIVIPVEDWPGDPGRVWSLLGLTISVADGWAECPNCNSSAKLKTTPVGGWWYSCPECGSCGCPADAVTTFRRSSDDDAVREWAASAEHPGVRSAQITEWRRAVRARDILKNLSTLVCDSVLGSQRLVMKHNFPPRKPSSEWGFVRGDKVTDAASKLARIGGFSIHAKTLASETDGSCSVALIPGEDGIRFTGVWVLGISGRWNWLGYRGRGWKESAYAFAPFGFSGVWINPVDALRRGGAVVRGSPAVAAALVKDLADVRNGNALVGRPLCPAGLALASVGNFDTTDRTGILVPWRDAAADRLRSMPAKDCAGFLSAANWTGAAPTSWPAAAKVAASCSVKHAKRSVVVCGSRTFIKLIHGWEDAETGEQVINRSVVVSRESTESGVVYHLSVASQYKTWTGSCKSRDFRRDPIGAVEAVCEGDVSYSVGVNKLLYHLAGSQVLNDG